MDECYFSKVTGLLFWNAHPLGVFHVFLYVQMVENHATHVWKLTASDKVILDAVLKLKNLLWK